MSRAQEYAQHCNETYSHQLTSQNLLDPNPGPPPTAKCAIITCMDARLDVFSMFGLKLGEAHVIRVGGGRAPDALRSLIASEHVLGTEEVMVVHHTDCGFSRASGEDEVRKEIKQALGGLTVEGFSLMPFGDRLEESVRADVEFLKRSPYVKKDAVLSGWVYGTLDGSIRHIV